MRRHLAQLVRAFPRLAVGGGLLALFLLLAPGAFAAEAEEVAPSGTARSGTPPDASGAQPAGEVEEALEIEVEEEDASRAGELAIPRPPRVGVEEIVITGEMLEAVVDDRVQSVIGFDHNVLKLEGIKDIRDLSNFTPTLEIKSAFAASNPTIFIRGVGLDDFNANAATAVAVYQDGVYMQSPAGQLFQFFDTESVQVLRGPQPTLYRNAAAGAILVNSRRPTEELDAYLTTTYGNYNAVEVEGALGGPIVPDLLLGRLSATWGIRDGITKNRCAAQAAEPDGNQVPPPCNQELQNGVRVVDPGIAPWTNDIDAFAARGQLLLKLPLAESESEWLLNFHGGQNNSRAYQYQHRGVRFQSDGHTPFTVNGRDVNFYGDTLRGGRFIPDRDPFAGDYNIDGPEDLSLWGTNLTGSWLFGQGYELRSLTAYEWNDGFTLENSDASPQQVLESEYEDKAWQVSQQLDLRGEWDSLIDSEIGEGSWTLGGYYLQEDLDVTNFFKQIGANLTQKYSQKTRNFSAFGMSEYAWRPGCAPIPCDFTLTAGLRYNFEWKEYETDVVERLGGITFQSLQGKDSQLWDGPGGEISLAWDYAEGSNVYFKYSRGWKGGHFNGSATSIRATVSSVDPEIIDSFEGGLRSYWWDDRLMLNLTGFYYDYQDLQVFIIEQTDLGYPIPKLVNASDAEVFGAELDLAFSPISGLNFTYNFAFVESEYKDFVVTFTDRIRPPKPCRACPPPPPIIIMREFDYSGNPLIASPRFSMTGAVEYNLPLPGSLLGQRLGSLTPRFSFVWKDEMFFDACSGQGTRCNFETEDWGVVFGQDAFWILNAALTWRSENERFELVGWVRNFLDQEYKTQNFDLTRGLGIILDAYADPRTFGLTATLSF